MTFHQLHCLISVAQYRNFTEAAKHLNIVQSAVSYHIAELEKELGAKLFSRKKNEIELTVAGEVLLEKAYEILAMTNEASLSVKKVSSGKTGRIRIGVPFAPLIDRYVEHFRSFQDRYPQMELQFRSVSSADLSARLESGQLDIGFTRYSCLFNKHLINWEPLYSDPLCAVVNRYHPLHRKEMVSLSEFDRDVLLLCERRSDPGWFDLVMDACVREHFVPAVDDRYTDLFMVLMMVEIGNGITVLPKGWQTHVNRQLHFLPIKDSEKNENNIFGIAWNRNSGNESIQIFLNEAGVLKE